MISDARAPLRATGAQPVLPTTVGVVIATYNHAHFLGEALESVEDEALRAPLVAVVEDWLRARA